MSENQTIDAVAEDYGIEYLLAQMDDASPAAEPGDFRKGLLPGAGTEDVPFAAAMSSVSSANYVTVYHTGTGLSSVISRNLLPAQLRKKREDGHPAFTVYKHLAPTPRGGNHVCYLNPNAEHYEKYMALGLEPCRKKNILNDYWVQMHMKKKHKAEWETIQAAEERERHQEEARWRDRQQDAMLVALGGKPAAAPVATGEAPVAVVPEAPVAPETPKAPSAFAASLPSPVPQSPVPAPSPVLDTPYQYGSTYDYTPVVAPETPVTETPAKPVRDKDFYRRLGQSGGKAKAAKRAGEK